MHFLRRLSESINHLTFENGEVGEIRPGGKCYKVDLIFSLHFCCRGNFKSVGLFTILII